MSKEMDFKNTMEEEIENRIKIMEDPTYDYGQPFNRWDVLGVILVGLVCIVGLIWGMS